MIVLILVQALLAGCAPWARVPMPAPTTLDRDDRVQLWIGGAPVVLRAVVVETDSIRGRTVPRVRGRPDSAVAVSRAAVDSFRLTPPDGNNWLGVGALGGFAAGVLIVKTLYGMAAGGT